MIYTNDLDVLSSGRRFWKFFAKIFENGPFSGYKRAIFFKFREKIRKKVVSVPLGTASILGK